MPIGLFDPVGVALQPILVAIIDVFILSPRFQEASGEDVELRL